MRRRMKFQKSMLIKSAALLITLSMIIGGTYIPVFAEEEIENKLPASESGDINSDNTAIENNKQDKSEADPEGSGETDNNGQDKTETIPDEDDKEKEPIPEEGIEEEPETEEKDDDEDVIPDDNIKKEEPEEERKDDDREIEEIVNVVVPASYILALNPYSLPISIGEDEITTEQVISGNYGIINKSSTDQIVAVSLIVEDRNEGELVFVDSAEEARNAEEGVYAVYLSAVPANGEEILTDGFPVDGNTTGEELQNVKMTGAQEQAVTLYGGVNQIAFKLSGAVYTEINHENADEAENDVGSESTDLEDEVLKNDPEMIFDELAPDGTGVTAYTFCGAMNPNAPWEKLSGGIKISVVYTYWMADGNEEIIEGTGAMISLD